MFLQIFPWFELVQIDTFVSFVQKNRRALEVDEIGRPAFELPNLEATVSLTRQKEVESADA